MHFSRFLPRRKDQWMTVLTTLILVIASTGSMLTLRRWGHRSTESMLTVLKMHHTIAHFDTYYAQAMTEENVTPALKNEIEHATQESYELLDEFQAPGFPHNFSQRVRKGFDAYLKAVNRKFEYLAQQDLTQAKAWDKSQVQPQHEALHKLLGDGLYEAEEIAEQTNLQVDVGSGLVIVLGALGIATLIGRSAIAERRMQLAIAEQTLLKQREADLQHGQELLEQEVNVRTQALRQKNESLAEAIKRLKIAQHELVQSEKMSALGRLIAGIAHEINTPLGAINASANNTSTALQEVLRNLSTVNEKLSESEQRVFYEILNHALQAKPLLTSTERRPFKKGLTQRLQHYQIANARTIADQLLDIGLHEGIEPYIPFLQSTHLDWSLKLLYNLTRLQNNSRNIQTAVERVSKTVFALKSYARFDHSGEKKCVALTDGIETVLELYHNQIKRGIRVYRQYQPIPPVWCYPDELIQVWTNLIHNAMQAMQERGTLTITVTQDLQNAIVQINDTGMGIDSDIAARIFQPFFTTKPVGEGSGLGLSICKQIIDKHSGEIQVESQPGKTTFSILLPLTETDLTTLEQPEVDPVQNPLLVTL